MITVNGYTTKCITGFICRRPTKCDRIIVIINKFIGFRISPQTNSFNKIEAALTLSGYGSINFIKSLMSSLFIKSNCTYA